MDPLKKILNFGKAIRNGVLETVSTLYSSWPLSTVISILTVGGIVSWVGLEYYGLPEFDDPYLGFETRGTKISDRLVTLENFRSDLKHLNGIENYPGEKLKAREGRAGRSLFCPKFPVEENSRVVLKIEHKDGFRLDYHSLMLVCLFQKKMEQLRSYEVLCETEINGSCCPMWSLPNYALKFSNKTIDDCYQLKQEDFEAFHEKYKICVELLQNDQGIDACSRKTFKCPLFCQVGGPIHSAIFFSLDKRVVTTSENISEVYTQLILPVPKMYEEDLEFRGRDRQTLIDSIENIVLPEEYVNLVAFDFGGKYRLFRYYLISDLRYVVMASVIILLVVCLYTSSLLVSLISFVSLAISLTLTYSVYLIIFRIPYFPFMNMLATIIVMGVGTDATLIIVTVWMRLKSEHSPVASKIGYKFIIRELLEETFIPLLITVSTTAAAFFAAFSSSITTIKCFSVFAGTSIMVAFFLILATVPPCLVVSDKIRKYLSSLIPKRDNDQDKTYFILCDPCIKIYSLVSKISIPLRRVAFAVNTFCLSHNTTLWSVSFAVSAALIFGALILGPTNFKLPNSEQFQLLSPNHPAEYYESKIQSLFSHSINFDHILPIHWKESDEERKITCYFIWGVQSQDNGNFLDPKNEGDLVYDKSFEISTTSSQKWLAKFCSELEEQPFYDSIGNIVGGAHYDACFIKTFREWMKRDCHSPFLPSVDYSPCCSISNEFPYKKDVFEECFGLAAKDVYRTPFTYFKPDIAGPKFMTESTQNETGSVKTFIIRATTNFSASFLYDRTNKYWETVETFFQKQLLSAPPELKNGFFVSPELDFFDLQTSLMQDTFTSLLLSGGLCFILLWLFSKSFIGSLGALATITAVVATTSAVLLQFMDWTLGVFESIAIVISIGLSCDFASHHSVEFTRRRSITSIMKPTLFSALTTLIMGLCMHFFSSVQVYRQIGAFFSVLITFSWLYSVFFLHPMLSAIHFVYTVLRAYCQREDKFSGFKCCARKRKYSYYRDSCNIGGTHDTFDSENEDESVEDEEVQNCITLINPNVLESEIQSSRRWASEGRLAKRCSQLAPTSDNFVEKWKSLKKISQETPV